MKDFSGFIDLGRVTNLVMMIWDLILNGQRQMQELILLLETYFRGSAVITIQRRQMFEVWREVRIGPNTHRPYWYSERGLRSICSHDDEEGFTSGNNKEVASLLKLHKTGFFRPGDVSQTLKLVRVSVSALMTPVEYLLDNNRSDGSFEHHDVLRRAQALGLKLVPNEATLTLAHESELILGEEGGDGDQYSYECLFIGCELPSLPGHTNPVMILANNPGSTKYPRHLVVGGRDNLLPETIESDTEYIFVLPEDASVDHVIDLTS